MKQISARTVKDTKIYGSNAIYMLDLRGNKRPSFVVKFKRLLVGIAVTALLLSLMAFGILKYIGGTGSIEQDVKWIQVDVEAGQSLWSLVRDHQPANNKVDIRDLVDIAAKHHDHGSMLQAGEVINIPVYKK